MINLYIDFSYWSFYFEKSISIIIPKSNKPLYNNFKIFWPIILLNILGKLIEKVINNRLQAHFIALNFIYLNQIEGIK